MVHNPLKLRMAQPFRRQCGDTNRTMIINISVFALHGIDVLYDVCFQQDGATCNTSHVTIDLLCQKFD